MKRRLLNLTAAAILLGSALTGCSDYEMSVPDSAFSSGCKVSFTLTNPSTKTEINDAADGFTWSLGDKVSVWAKNSAGTYTLENQVFSLYARDFYETGGYFTSTLASAMAAGTYSYYIAYPVPQSVSGTSATFELPSTQDGKASSGIDITLSGEISHKELAEVTEDDQLGLSEDTFQANLHHILHFLRFYIPAGENLLGEPVQKIVFSMPQNIAGTITVDVTDPSSAKLSDGKKEMTLNLTEALKESSASDRQYAVAGIFPPESAYTLSDYMEVTLYSENKLGKVSPICLGGRTFAAGHVTGVKLSPSSVQDYYTINFRLASNNLGEEVQKVTMTLPDGYVWPDTGSSEYTYSKKDGSDVLVGDTFSISTSSESAYRAVSTQSVTVKFESEDAIVSETLALADLSSGNKTSVNLDVPYLFYEDFSELAADFHSNDEYSSLFVTGDKSGVEFLTGWSGGRVGGQAGTSIRITARREVSARYAARCDSPFLTGLKHTVSEFTALGKSINLKVLFNYSMGRDEGLIAASIGQTMYFGYTSKTGTISSGTEDGTFDEGLLINETTGSFTNIDHEAERSLSGMGSDLRLSWRTYTEYNAWSNSSCYLYLDNIRVRIEK